VDFFEITSGVVSLSMELPMPLPRKLVTVLFVLFGLAVIQPAKADSVITLASAATSVDSSQSNSNGSNIAITPNSAWATALPGSSWVSFTTTGDSSASNFVTVPNGTVVSFFDTFTLAGAATSGTLSVMADDSATVLLNGVQLIGETLANNTYAICSDFGVGCLQPTVLELPVSLLQTGTNTLEFEVAQRDGSSFGLDFLGSITDPSPVSTPEASSGAFLVLALLGMAAFGSIRKATGTV
jgi:hypothetical protein